MLKVNNPDAGKGEKAKQGEQLIAPLHEGDLNALCSACQSRTW